MNHLKKKLLKGAAAGALALVFAGAATYFFMAITPNKPSYSSYELPVRAVLDAEGTVTELPRHVEELPRLKPALISAQELKQLKPVSRDGTKPTTSEQVK